MPRFTYTHELDCTPDRFWQLYFADDFNKALFAFLQFPEWKVIDQKEDDAKIVRKVKAIPKFDAPGAVVKVLGSSFGYSEVGTFDKAKKVFSFAMTPNVLADKMKNEGTIRLEPLGDAKSRRVVEIFLEVKIFGIGGAAEGASEKSHRYAWDKSAEFTNRWVKDHP